MATPGSIRQAAFKERMREAGKRPLQIWVNNEQGAAIMAFLSGAPLPVTAVTAMQEDPAVQRADLEERERAIAVREAELKAAESAIHDHAKQVESLQVETRHYRAKQAEADEQLKAAEQKRRALDQREKKLAEREKQAGLLTGKKEPAPSGKVRADALVEKFTTHTSYVNNKRYELDTSWDVGRRLEQLTAMTRQAKASSTALHTLRESFAELLSPHEGAIIGEASRVLSDLGNASTHAKEVVGRKVKVLKRDEEQREAAAKTAVDQVFGGIEVASQICLILHRQGSSRGATRWAKSVLEEIESGRHVNYEFKTGLEDALSDLRNVVAKEIRNGTPASEAAHALRKRFDADLARLSTQHKELIDLTQAALVQATLQKVNRPT